MKLGTRIISGFGGLIGLTVALGGLAAWNMNRVKQDSGVLARDYMPAILAANEVERQALLTMYEIRGYAYTEATNFLGAGTTRLAETLKAIETAKTLAKNSSNGRLTFLDEAAGQAASKAREYEQLTRQTVTVTEALQEDRAKMDTAAQAYMEVCHEYLKSQRIRLEAALEGTNQNAGAFTDPAASQVAVAEVRDRLQKTALANEIITLGNQILVGNFKAQAMRDPQLFEQMHKQFVTVHDKLDALKAITKQEVNLKQIETCRAAARDYDTAMEEFLKYWRQREDLNTRRVAVAEAVLAAAKTTAISSAESSGQMANRAAASLASSSSLTMVGLGVAAVLGISLAVFITRSITTRIKGVADLIAAGSEQTSAASAQVSAASQSLAEGASEQAASLEETSSSLEEMASMTRRNAENATRANSLAQQARQAADAGADDMRAMTQSMQEIKESSDDIAKIIKTIDEIAFQTNILALNAAVEAARAGEAGMGFAVVADEVRSLAQRSAQAAKETAAKIEGAIERTERGVTISGKVSHGLQEIVGKAREVDQLAGEVAAASREQSQGIEQINLAVGQMDKVTQANAASAEESASAAEELKAQADSLKEAVAELQQLVGGSRSLEATSPMPAKAGLGKAAKTPTIPDSGRSRALAHAGGNGDGHRRPVTIRPRPHTLPEPSLAGATSEPAREEAFRDF